MTEFKNSLADSARSLRASERGFDRLPTEPLGLLAGFEVAFADLEAALAVVERLLPDFEVLCGMGWGAAARSTGGGDHTSASEVRLLRSDRAGRFDRSFGLDAFGLTTFSLTAVISAEGVIPAGGVIPIAEGVVAIAATASALASIVAAPVRARPEAVAMTAQPPTCSEAGMVVTTARTQSSARAGLVATTA